MRLQRKRTKGYRLPPNAKSVCRPGRWGNPIRLIDVGPLVQQQAARAKVVDADQIHQLAQQVVVDLFTQLLDDPHRALGEGFAVSDFIRQRFIWMRQNLALLKGQHLACFCPLLTKEGYPTPCHAAILLRYANQNTSLHPLIDYNGVKAPDDLS